ncbi:reverse transcriptase domain-containing protein [Tanacetum coccineum]|uniref:Reverse transcriptase domain-containing protein n=1 Tax=Tanacetum coccineum TaxID=301880 RepID=A0ABQ5G9I5_9ASTR
MLERLAGNEYYCFLDGFSGYFQIPIDPQDQEKTTFTCPYGTFAYRRMPFGLCNAPGMFQRCIIAIFHDMIEETMEVFMEDFLVFWDSFSSCLSHLDKMLKRCKDTNLVLNWEKCHFMVKEGIVLGHKISKSGIEFDKAKVDVIAKLPHLTSVKGIQIIVFTEPIYAHAPHRKKTFITVLTLVNVKAKSRKEMKRPKMQFKYARSLTYGASILWARSRLIEGTSTFSLPLTTLSKRVKPKRSPLTMPRTVGGNRASWSDKLDDALWACRTAFKTPIECTLYKLVYGKACHLPIELEHKALLALNLQYY